MDNLYNFKIGDFHCLAVNDGGVAGNAKLLFYNAPEEELGQVLERHGLKADHLPSTWTCLLIKTATKTLLVDAGFGSGGRVGGQLLPSLHRAGIQPENIDVVFLSHAHADHVGGCINEAGQSVFPNATHYMSKEEWEFWTTETNLQSVSEWAANFAREKLPPLAGIIKLVEGETEIVPGIRAIVAHGHTAGHMAIEVESHGQYLIALIDTALHPIQVEYPGWYSQLDQNPEQTIETRKAIYRRIAEREALVLAFHFPPFPSLGHIVEQDGSWAWRPLPN